MPTFAYALNEIVPGGGGSKAMAYGTYTNSGSATGGAITTGLETISRVILQPGGTAVVADKPSVVTAFPIANKGTVTIKTTADDTGYWLVFGY
jgi:hypothetical protein